jgi:hypothetical protein
VGLQTDVDRETPFGASSIVDIGDCLVTPTALRLDGISAYHFDHSTPPLLLDEQPAVAAAYMEAPRKIRFGNAI